MYYNKGISYFFRIIKELKMEWDNEWSSRFGSIK
jgi:hypothetical protein